MVPFSMPLALCDAKISANVAPHFDYLDITKALVPLMKPLAPHDADAGSNGITSPKSHVASAFDYLDQTNGRVLLMALLASCDTDTNINGIT